MESVNNRTPINPESFTEVYHNPLRGNSSDVPIPRSYLQNDCRQSVDSYPTVMPLLGRYFDLQRLLFKNDNAEIWEAFGENGPFIVKANKSPEYIHGIFHEGRVMWLMTQYLPMNRVFFPLYYGHFTIGRNQACLVLEKLQTDLYEFQKSRRAEGKPLSVEELRFHGRIILTALSELHAYGIIHGDIKPENILLDHQNRCKIADFGLAQIYPEWRCTTIQSQPYRAPEVVLGGPMNTGVDIWSFGCMMYNLLSGSMLFRSSNDWEHMSQIVTVFGMPEKKLLNQCNPTQRKIYFKLGRDGKFRSKLTLVGGERTPLNLKLAEVFDGSSESKEQLKMLKRVITCATRLEYYKRMPAHGLLSLPFFQKKDESNLHS